MQPFLQPKGVSGSLNPRERPDTYELAQLRGFILLLADDERSKVKWMVNAGWWMEGRNVARGPAFLDFPLKLCRGLLSPQLDTHEPSRSPSDTESFESWPSTCAPPAKSSHPSPPVSA